MPPLKIRVDKESLYKRGITRVRKFCTVNNLKQPHIKKLKSIDFDTCAYYRSDTIYIHLSSCSSCATEHQSRNWNWPGCKTDREPYGVLCHELGHHCDILKSDVRGSYMGDYSVKVRKESGESQLTSYCPNDGEWFAEMFRLFVSNAALLKLLKPRTWEILIGDWVPVSSPNWKIELGSNVPERVLRNMERQANA